MLKKVQYSSKEQKDLEKKKKKQPDINTGIIPAW